MNLLKAFRLNLQPASRMDIKKIRSQISHLERVNLSLIRKIQSSNKGEIFENFYEIKSVQSGILMLLDPTSLVDRSLLNQGSWEANQIEQLFEFIDVTHTRPALFLDIGAYTGLYSFAALNSGHFDRIIAFEPDITNRCQLYANLFLNNAQSKIEVIHAALSDHNGKLDFNDSREIENGNRGGVGHANSNHGAHLSVPCMTLDSLLDLKDNFIVMKIDVEGHELNVLDGMENIVKANKILIQVESFSNQVEAFKLRAGEFGLKYIKSIYPDHYFANFDL